MGIHPLVIQAGSALRMDGKGVENIVSSFHQGTSSYFSLDIDAREAAQREYVVARNGRVFNAAYKMEMGDAFKMDSFDASAGLHVARQLDFVYEKVLEEKFPEMSGRRLFSVSSEVDPGARTHTQRRFQESGEARVWRGPDGSGIPRVALIQEEEQFNVRFLVSGFGWDIFEQMSSDFAGTQQQMRKQRASHRAIAQLENRLIWQGSNVHGLYGIFNYPWLPKFNVGALTKAAVLANPTTALQILNDIANYPTDVSKGLFEPTVMTMTKRQRDILATTLIDATSGVSVLEQFMKNTPYIKRLETAFELRNAGGANVDGILVYRDDDSGIRIQIPQDIQQLPAQQQGLETTVANWEAYGGVIMEDPLQNLLAFAQVL